MQLSYFLVGVSVITGGLLVAIAALLLILLVGRIRRKFQDRREKVRIEFENKVAEVRSQELQWYREKRFLMERQAVEKHHRLAELIDSLSPDRSHRFTFAASRLFFVAESIREERQYLGTDISKLSMIDRRLRSLGKECIERTTRGEYAEKWLSEMSLCRQMIQSNLEDLRKAQNLLRSVLGEVSGIEQMASRQDLEDDQIPDLVTSLEEVKLKINQLPDGLRTVARNTGERAQALFHESTRHLPEEGIFAVWKEQLSLDLFSSKHRPGGKSELLSAVDAALSSMHMAAHDKEPFAALRAGAKSQSGAPGETARDEESSGSDTSSNDRGDRDKPLSPVESEAANDSAKISPQGYQFKSTDTAAILEISGTGENDSEKSEREDRDQHHQGYTFLPPETKVAREEDSFWSVEETAPVQPSVEKSKSQEEVSWVTPLDLGLSAGQTGDKPVEFNPFTSSEVAPGKKLEPGSGLVIFRSRDPGIWNSTINEDEDHRAIALSEISGDPKWLGIKRTDTGEQVFGEVSKEDLKGSGEGLAAGFNGSNEFFYGARHLGFFSEECPTEVETRFTYGGWGFGHLSNAEGGDDEVQQISGWNGRRIPDGTVFEISLYQDRPPEATDDRVIL